MSNRSYLFYFYLFFCGFLCLALLEIAERVRIRLLYGFGKGSVEEIYQFDERSGLRIPIPNKRIKGYKTQIKINSLGFRGNEIDLIKGKRTVRLAVLGASTTFCAEVSNNDRTWPALVASMLTNKYPPYKFEIINGGVPGYTITSSLKNLRYRISKLEPDIVLVYHATNDISYWSRQAAKAKGIINDDRRHAGSRLMSFLSRYSKIFDLLHKNITILMLQKQTDNSDKLVDFPTGYVRPFIAGLDSIRYECEKIGIPLVVFTFSKKFRHFQNEAQLLENMDIALYYMPWMSPESLFGAFDLFNKEMFKFAQKHENVYIDTLDNLIPGDSEHFVDSVHFTDQGCQLMAERVSNALIREGIIENVIIKLTK